MVILLYCMFDTNQTQRVDCTHPLYTKRKAESKIQLFSIAYIVYPLPRIRRSSSSVIGVSPCKICVAVSSPSNISMKMAIPQSDK